MPPGNQRNHGETVDQEGAGIVEQALALEDLWSGDAAASTCRTIGPRRRPHAGGATMAPSAIAQPRAYPAPASAPPGRRRRWSRRRRRPPGWRPAPNCRAGPAARCHRRHPAAPAPRTGPAPDADPASIPDCWARRRGRPPDGEEGRIGRTEAPARADSRAAPSSSRMIHSKVRMPAPASRGARRRSKQLLAVEPRTDFVFSMQKSMLLRLPSVSRVCRNLLSRASRARPSAPRPRRTARPRPGRWNGWRAGSTREGRGSCRRRAPARHRCIAASPRSSCP